MKLLGFLTGRESFLEVIEGDLSELLKSKVFFKGMVVFFAGIIFIACPCLRGTSTPIAQSIIYFLS